MTFASEPFATAPFSADDGAAAEYLATSLGPLLKFGAHAGRVNLIGAANSVSPLLKFGSHDGSIHWTPRNIAGRAMPVYPLFKFGTPEYLLPMVPVSIGPLLKFSGHAGILGKKTGLANYTGPLFKLGIPLGVFVSNYQAAPVGSLLKFGEHAGIVDMSGQANGLGPLLKFGTPSGQNRRRASTVHVLTTNQVVYVSKRKAS